MTSRIEPQASNQYAAGIAGLALARACRNSASGREEARRHADRLFASQHGEGWFEEYGGPDFAITHQPGRAADHGDATGDPRVAIAVQRAVEFLAGQVADGAPPSSLNSRNTDYAVLNGLVRAAARLPAASWLVHRLFAGAATQAISCGRPTTATTAITSMPALSAACPIRRHGAPSRTRIGPARLAARLRVPGRPRRGSGLFGPCGSPQGRDLSGSIASAYPWSATAGDRRGKTRR